MTIFQRLGYNFPEGTSEIVPELSEDSKKTLQSMPDFMTDWQAYDVSNSQASGYTRNPVGNVTITILNNLDVMANACIDEIVTDEFGQPEIILIDGLEPIYNATIIAIASGNEFKKHTDRVSGITRPQDIDPQEDPDALKEPFFDTAIGVGKTILYITSQTDGITNSAPVLGSFTSLFVEPQLNVHASNVVAYTQMVLESIVIIPETEGSSEQKTSNLTPTQANTITTGINTLISLMDTRRTHDSNFFKQSREVMQDMERTRVFTTGGESERSLIEHISTPKLQERMSRQDTMSIPKSTTKTPLPNNVYDTFIGSDGFPYVNFSQLLDEYIPADYIVNSDPIVGDSYNPNQYRNLYAPDLIVNSENGRSVIQSMRTGYNKNQYWRIYIPRGTIGVDLKVSSLKETNQGEFIFNVIPLRSDSSSIELPTQRLPWVASREKASYRASDFFQVINSDQSYQANLFGSKEYYLSAFTNTVPYLQKGVWVMFKTGKVPGNIIHSIDCKITVNPERYAEWFTYMEQYKLWDTMGNPPVFLKPQLNFQYN